MFGIGFPELILILVVGLVVFGPGKLPEVARSLGKGVREFKKVTDEVTNFTDLDKPLNSPPPPNPANPSRPAVPPVFIKEEEVEVAEVKEPATKEVTPEVKVATTASSEQSANTTVSTAEKATPTTTNATATPVEPKTEAIKDEPTTKG